MSLGAARSEGFADLVKHYEKGTAEIRYLLDKECEMLYECKWCREIFRSIVTFTSHKRSTCRSMFGDLADELDLAKKFQKRQRDERGDCVFPFKQGRTNLEAVMDERSRPVSVTLPHTKKQMEVLTLPRSVTKSKPVTEFVGGYQRLVDMPTEVAIASQIPDDRVVVVMPQEKSSRYGEMQLRNRRVDGRYATLTADQMKIFQRIPDDVLAFAEVGTLRCKHSQCKSFRAFNCFDALAYHLTLTHHAAGDVAHRCYLCDSKTYLTFEKLKNHLKLKHSSIRRNHLDTRKKQSRRSSRRTTDHDHRSISPAGYAENDVENESGNGSDNGLPTATSPVFLQSSIKTEEVDIVDEPMPTLKRIPVRRGRRQKGKSAVIKPTLSPAKIRQQPIAANDSIEQDSLNAVEFSIGNIDDFLNIRSNETSLSKQLQPSRKSKSTKSASKRSTRSAREVSHGSTSTTSEETVSCHNHSSKECVQKEDLKEDKVNVNELMETDSADAEANEQGEPSTKRRKPVSLIKGRTPRQRAQTSRLANDYVVPKRFASTTNLLSENQFRAFAKEQAKQLKKEKRTRRKRKHAPETEVDTTANLQEEAEDVEDEETVEEQPAQTRRRGFSKRKLDTKEVKSQSKCSSQTPEEDDEMDNATQKFFQQVKKSLTKASTPSIDQPLKKEGTNSLNSSSCASPEPANQEEFILPPLSTVKGASDSSQLKEGSLPPSSAIRSGSTNASPMKTVLPSILTGSKSELINCSPRSKLSRPLAITEGVPKISDDTRGESASRRKQNFGDKSKDNDAASDLKLVQIPGQQPLKPDDLTLLPVTLNTSQRRMLFGPLKPLFNANREGSDGLHQCAECGTVCKTLAEGQKHMVSHVRMVRLKCSLCDAGSFFCTDMRKHLMYRHCEKLHYAPSEMISPGTPCMDALTADKLIRITDQNDPGRAMFTRGKIISAEKPTPYMPDPRIEQRLLGSLRSVTRASPRKIVLTNRKKSPSDDLQQGTSAGDDTSQQANDPQSFPQVFNGDDEGGRSSEDSTPPITTNDLLNQAENADPTSEFLISYDAAEKKSDNYQLPLTIRANPLAGQKTPSPEPSTSAAQETIIAEQLVTSQLEAAQSDSAGFFSHTHPLKPNILSGVSSAIRALAPKPSILSRSPVKIPSTPDTQPHPVVAISTSPVQLCDEAAISEPIEQTRATSKHSEQLDLDDAETDEFTGAHTNVEPDPFSFSSDQTRIIVDDN